ncbi:MAG: hypothetical protein EOM20_07440 [Spartobacteria bacterium]|nr:hypothetical protein [Spartobacteria bacterium]
MKTSRWIALCVVILIASGSVVATSQDKDARPVVVKGYSGRYQLFQGTFFENRGKGVDRMAVFKIDSITGDTWIYREGIDTKGDFYSRWSLITD